MELPKLTDILFLDIETVSAYPTFADAPEAWQNLWTTKALRLKQEDTDTPESLYPRAAIYAEFGKIICISVGVFDMKSDGRFFRLKSFVGDNEVELLTQFSAMLGKYFNRSNHRMAAHNGKEFDFAYLGRRILVNNLPLPRLLQLQGKKPWEIPHIDTMELWKFGDGKSYTSLNLLTQTLNIPSPKEVMDGSQIHQAYYHNHNLETIAHYCQTDVLAVAQVYLRLTGQTLLTPDEVVYV